MNWRIADDGLEIGRSTHNNELCHLISFCDKVESIN